MNVVLDDLEWLINDKPWKGLIYLTKKQSSDDVFGD
jgi:hypothetical protein